MSLESLLDAPCLFCGYNGVDYYQSGTHGADCPWRTVGGMFRRQDTLPGVIRSLASKATQRPGIANERRVGGLTRAEWEWWFSLVRYSPSSAAEGTFETVILGDDDSIKALIAAAFDQPSHEECRHESWEDNRGWRTCVDCRKELGRDIL